MKRLKKMDMFATPDSIKALEAYVTRFTGGERSAAIVVMGMTWNLCAELTKRDSVLDEQEGGLRSGVDNITPVR
jgi:hypothetical protein